MREEFPIPPEFLKEYRMRVLPSLLLQPSGHVLSFGGKIQAFALSLFSPPPSPGIGSSEYLIGRMKCLADCIRKERRDPSLPTSAQQEFDRLCSAFEKRLEVCQADLPEGAWKVGLQDWREKRALLIEILSNHKSWIACDKKDFIERVQKKFCRDQAEKIQLVASLGFHALAQVAWYKEALPSGMSTLILFPFLANSSYLLQNHDFLPVQCALQIQKFVFIGRAMAASKQVFLEQKPLASCSFFELISLQYLSSVLFNALSPSSRLAQKVNGVTSLGLMGYSIYSGLVLPLSRWTISLFKKVINN